MSDIRLASPISAMSINDVPSPIDFHDPEGVKAWIEETARKRPWRPECFNVYVETLNKKFHHPVSILELGAGPGLLAEQILRRCAIRSFVVLDFSAAMLSIAGHRLEPFWERTRFVQRDFRSSNWVDGMGEYDAVISMQAVHEVRHKQHIPALLAQIYVLLVPNGLCLFCDHYAEPDNRSKNPDLYLTREDQAVALLNARFSNIECVFDKGGMALWSATSSSHRGKPCPLKLIMPPAASTMCSCFYAYSTRISLVENLARNSNGIRSVRPDGFHLLNSAEDSWAEE